MTQSLFLFHLVHDSKILHGFKDSPRGAKNRAPVNGIVIYANINALARRRG